MYKRRFVEGGFASFVLDTRAAVGDRTLTLFGHFTQTPAGSFHQHATPFKRQLE